MVVFIFYCELVMVCCESMKLVRFFYNSNGLFSCFNLRYFIFIFYIL